MIKFLMHNFCEPSIKKTVEMIIVQQKAFSKSQKQLNMISTE